MSHPDLTRDGLIRRARKQIAEIDQLFADTAHWNRINPGQEPLNPDEDGKLAQIRSALQRMLLKEGAR